jgi:hypothetical protein
MKEEKTSSFIRYTTPTHRRLTLGMCCEQEYTETKSLECLLFLCALK